MLLTTFLKHFQIIEDPRIENHNHRHELMDILVITILGTICGADTWTEICEFADAKQDWLKPFLQLAHGVPSHDTFGRVFSLLNPEMFEACFLNWMKSLKIDVNKEIIAIDGKTLRGSSNKRKKQPALHLVSAWATQNRVVLGQVRAEAKSNEIEAIPRLLNIIDIKNSIVTIDAMGCQQTIAKQIITQEGNYVLSLKENQITLYQDVVSLFNQGEARQFKKILHRRKLEKT